MLEEKIKFGLKIQFIILKNLINWKIETYISMDWAEIHH